MIRKIKKIISYILLPVILIGKLHNNRILDLWNFIIIKFHKSKILLLCNFPIKMTGSKIYDIIFFILRIIIIIRLAISKNFLSHHHFQ